MSDHELKNDVKDHTSHELDRGSDFEHDAGGVDVGDMYRMGKEQQFKRIFRVSTMMFFTSMVQATWEVVLIAPNAGLINGGLAGLFWSYIWTFIGFSFIVVSLAEMASMAPTSGGQYHWVSEFAPRRYQRFLSYMSGWMATLSWLAGSAGGSFIIGTLIQGILSSYDSSYLPKTWQGTLFVFAVVTVEGIVNIWLVEWLPWLQTIMILPHGLGWIAVIAFLAVLAPTKASAHDVFLSITSNGGWDNLGVGVMVGQIAAVYFLILSDAAAHLAEEVKTASRAVPQAMIWSYILNGTVGFFVLIAFLFAIPNIADIMDPTKNPSGFAFLYVLQNSSYWGCLPIIIIVLAITLVGSIDSNASTSRQTFAFARDGGLPFGSYLSRVSKGLNGTPVPRNSILFTCIITALLSLINLGSSVAFNAIISLQLMALMATYTISIGCVLWQRTVNGGAHLPYARWSLGRFGAPINAIAFVYSLFIFFWVPWPGAKDPSLEAFNWSPVMFGGVFIISLIYYVIWGRKSYKGPVVLVRTGTGVPSRGGSF